MPIYEYRCSSCGHEKEVLQKMSDAPLAECPACGKSSFRKLISAAGFQLKGSGWYATDFKGGSKKSDASKDEASKDTAEAKKDAGSKDESKPKQESKAKEESKSDAPASGSGATTA
ncbi:MAG TPA: zinc ribbon domain-containing protein [Burkholderiales bacterium]